MKSCWITLPPMKNTIKALLIGLLALAATPRSDAQNLVQNGNFADYTDLGDARKPPTGWTITGFDPSVTGQQAGAYGFAGVARLGPGRPPGVIPGILSVGGTYFGSGRYNILQTNYYEYRLEQEISNLVIGQSYELSFYTGYDGQGQLTIEGEVPEHVWRVGFGDETQDGAVVRITSWGTGADWPAWQKSTMTFTATEETQTLSFVNHRLSPTGPIQLALTGVSLTAIPEPSTAALSVLALGGLALTRRRRHS